MQTLSRAIVVTTINGPNACLNALSEGAGKHAIPFLVIGDVKSPADFSLPNSDYYSIARQVSEFADICSVLPEKHYARKNIGYLLAMRAGVAEIQETDDDNLPLDAFWEPVAASAEIEEVRGQQPWFNVYAMFTDVLVWPRGLPLEYLHSSGLASAKPAATAISRALIVQGLADGNPDVDAVFRLTRELPLDFKQRAPVVLAPGTWCPFNSQNTIFRREVFPLLYLPSFCSFRMTDIWRSFVAQRCLWELGEGVVFHSSTVHQDRNEHNLLKDFEDEVPGYLHNDKIRLILEACKLDGSDLLSSLVLCYEALVKEKLLPEAEMSILRKWCDAVRRNSS